MALPRWIRRPGRKTGITLAVIGLLLIGAGAGHLLAPARQVRSVSVVRADATGANTAPSVMPDVLGLTKQIARRAVFDANVTSTVTTNTAPAAGPPGRVLQQMPEPGTRAVTRVALTLSRPAKVPALIGSDMDTARATLQKLGAAVLVRQEVAPAATVRSVLKSDPPAGATLTESITLTVAYPGDAINLADVNSVDSNSCGTDSATVSGKTLDTSVTCGPSTDSHANVTYVIGRHAQVVQATLGLDDAGQTGSAVARVIADGRVLRSFALRYGHAAQIQLRVRGVLRLVLDTSTSSTDNAPTVVWGNISLLGTQAELDNLRR